LNYDADKAWTEKEKDRKKESNAMRKAKKEG